MSWKGFLNEVIAACKEKNVPYADLKKWIYAMIPNVEKDALAFHVFTGPTPSFQDLLLEFHILTDNILYEFTINEESKEYNIYRFKTITAVYQETSEGYVEFDFRVGSAPLLIIEIREEELDRITRFIQEIVARWE